LDGTLLFTAAESDSIALPRFPEAVDAIAVTSDRRAIVSGPHGNLRVYDLEHNKTVAVLESPVRIEVYRISPDGKRMLTLPMRELQANAVLWDLQHYRMLARLDSPGHMFSARFVKGGQEILTASNDGSSSLWDGETGGLLRRYVGNDQYLRDAVLSP